MTHVMSATNNSLANLLRYRPVGVIRAVNEKRTLS